MIIALRESARTRRRSDRIRSKESDVRQPPSPIALPGFRVSLKTFAPGQKLAWASSVPGRLCVMMAGEMLETARARRISYRPGELVYKSPEERPHLAFSDGGVRTVTIELESYRLATLADAGLSLQRSFRHASAAGRGPGARIP